MPHKRILILSTSYLPLIGGSELAIQSIARKLPDFQFDLVTARVRTDLPVRERMGNVMIYRVGRQVALSRFLLPKNFLPLWIFWKARQLHRQHHYSLIHAYQSSQAGGAAWLLKWFYPRLPFVLTLQEGKDLDAQSWLLKYFRRRIIRKADWVTVISSFLKKFVLATKSNVAISVIPNGVDIEKFGQPMHKADRDALLAQYGISSDGTIIMTASRLVEKNGVANLIKAHALITQPVQLIIAGSGPLHHTLEKLVGNLGIAQRVHFLGDVPHRELHRLLKVADVFVRPSLSEGLGNAFLEALAAGVPIIGTAVGGIPDFLVDGETGLFCDPRDPQDIAQKITTIIQNPELARHIVQRGILMLRERYDWSTIASQMRTVYNHFL